MTKLDVLISHQMITLYEGMGVIAVVCFAIVWFATRGA
jgi:hypothetical protein